LKPGNTVKTSFHLQYTLLAMALASAYPLSAVAAPSAGVAQFTAGEVSVRRADGKTDTLVKGKDIESGQSIITGANGRAQVKFTDGGLISLQPGTEFKVANYVDKADPKEDRFLVDLLRGSMRAITGLIGKRNRENYKVTTTTATIGIRGSGFNAGYNPDGSLSVTTELDAIEVCNSGGCVGLTAGESVRVINNTDAPVRTNVRATVPTPPPDQDPIVVGNNTNAEGKAAIVVGAVVPPVQRTFTDLQVAALGTNGGSQYSLLTAAGATAVFSDNKLLKVDDNAAGFGGIWSETGTPQPEANFKGIGSVTDANFIGWGTWTTGQKDYLGVTMLDNVHYVAGRPTSQADISALAYSGNVFYTLVGNTAPTQNGVAGTLNSATFQVNFSTGYTITVAIDTNFVSFTDTASGSTPTFSGSYIKGMFIGSNAAFAGLTYAKDPGNGLVTGALAFQK
jgi:hypothetical protein